MYGKYQLQMSLDLIFSIARKKKIELLASSVFQTNRKPFVNRTRYTTSYSIPNSQQISQDEEEEKNVWRFRGRGLARARLNWIATRLAFNPATGNWKELNEPTQHERSWKVSCLCLEFVVREATKLVEWHVHIPPMRLQYFLIFLLKMSLNTYIHSNID